MTQSLFNWCQDLEMALQNGGEHDPELRTARLEMAAEWLRRFPTEDALTTGNFRRALADSYFETGHQQKEDELYQSWLDDDPAWGWGWGWIGWAGCYTPSQAPADCLDHEEPLVSHTPRRFGEAGVIDLYLNSPESPGLP
jgi:hypothetical protein